LSDRQQTVLVVAMAMAMVVWVLGQAKGRLR